MSESNEQRPKRQKRETSYKAKALEKFKQLKSRKKYEIEEIENVFDTVEEKDYAKKVMDRQDDDWIVDDDGSGYVEDGRDIFDDDLDYESISQANNKGVKRKKKSALNTSKGNLQFMLSNMPVKKKEEVKIDGDDMLSEILDEIDETPTSSIIKPSREFIPRKKVTQNYMKSFSIPKKIKAVINTKVAAENSTSESSTGNNLPELSSHDNVGEVASNVNKSEFPTDDNLTGLETSILIQKDNFEKSTADPLKQSENVNHIHDDFESDFDMTQIDEIESQALEVLNDSTSNEKLKNSIYSADFDQLSLSNNDFDNHVDNGDIADLSELTKNGEKPFRFFWWDAFEDPEKQKGTIFLFGKTFCEKSKSYASCCVAVKNIMRQIFLLPREHLLDDDYQETDQEVTFQDLYNEFKTLIAAPLQIKSFRSAKARKKYVFDASVPRESDYLEVQYPATDPYVSLDLISKVPKSFSKMFGMNTSCLERFLLEKKIKGPCWLEVSKAELNNNPLSWCKFEINCSSEKHISKVEEKLDVPPLVVSALNFRHYQNPRTNQNEILMVSCITQTNYMITKQPTPPFNKHFCAFTCPSKQPQPMNIHEALKNYKGTKVQKMDSEKALLNYFVAQFNRIDPDLIVGFDVQGCQNTILANRLIVNNIMSFSKLSKLKRSQKKRLERELFTGRLVCDLKLSAKELIRLRTYDMDALCQHVLKFPENHRIDLEPDEIPRMYEQANNIINLITYTMQDTSYILKILYDLNVVPLSLQITNIAGNIMSKTLMGGRSERNEFLLLHAFSEKGYLVPDKKVFKRNEKEKRSSKKKPTYSGGLVLEPKVGFYDKLLLLMDFNSLYPSIIQEYNICFTTLPITDDDENLILPDSSLPPGILPTEIKKLVDSRRQVKSLMSNADPDLKMQYHIRQMALKLTANSMYGCLGFSNSRFYAKNLAALITLKGREILTNTKNMVEKMCYEVVYGDTDSIMINTNILDFDQVYKVGIKIKQEINKLYKQVELDIDGVFKYLLLLKKKKYAAVTLSKTKDGKFKEEKEYKGLDIVRRDWSQIASEAGKFVLEHILSDQSQDDRISNMHTYLSKIKDELKENRVPLQLLVITKQLTKDPHMYPNKDSLPHVQVALRYNKEHGVHYRSGDTVCYIICEDGTNNSATQRAYHIEEFKKSENLKIDVNYYLSQQIHPVVARICEPIEGTDASQIAECLGLDGSNFKTSVHKAKPVGENIIRPEVKFRNVENFVFKCLSCESENTVTGPFQGNASILEQCSNNICKAKPISYLAYIQNQLSQVIYSYISRYYENKLICEDPLCTNETNRIPLIFHGKFPLCKCGEGYMYKKYSEKELYTQLSYLLYIFDIKQSTTRPLVEESVIHGYQVLSQTVEKFLNHSAFAFINLSDIFGYLAGEKPLPEQAVDDITNLNEEEIEFSDGE